MEYKNPRSMHSNDNLAGSIAEGAGSESEQLFLGSRRKVPDHLSSTSDTNRPGPSKYSRAARKRKPTMESVFVSTMESVQEFLNRPQNSTPVACAIDSLDEDELFCQSLIKKLRAFPAAVRNDIKVSMLQYLNDVEREVDSKLN